MSMRRKTNQGKNVERLAGALVTRREADLERVRDIRRVAILAKRVRDARDVTVREAVTGDGDEPGGRRARRRGGRLAGSQRTTT